MVRVDRFRERIVLQGASEPLRRVDVHLRHKSRAELADRLRVDQFLWLNLLSHFLGFAAELSHITLEWDQTSNSLANLGLVEEISDASVSELEYFVNCIEGHVEHTQPKGDGRCVAANTGDQ